MAVTTMRQGSGTERRYRFVTLARVGRLDRAAPCGRSRCRATTRTRRVPQQWHRSACRRRRNVVPCAPHDRPTLRPEPRCFPVEGRAAAPRALGAASAGRDATPQRGSPPSRAPRARLDRHRAGPPGGAPRSSHLPAARQSTPRCRRKSRRSARPPPGAIDVDIETHRSQ